MGSIGFPCKYQYRKKENPFTLCGLFPDEEVICGSEGYETLCEKAEPIGESNDSVPDTRISNRSSN